MSAYEEWRGLRTAPAPMDGGLVEGLVDRAFRARRERARAARLAALEDGLRRGGERMARYFAGSPTDRWGVLSGAHGTDLGRSRTYSLETTLKALVAECDEPARGTARTIAGGLPVVRAHAELGRHDHLHALEQELLRLVDAPGLSADLRRRLIDHLPAALRPLPPSLSDLHRSAPPVTLWVTMHGPDEETAYRSEAPWIKLNDIVLPPSLKGHGLGSAVLAELCAYADHHGLPIQGEIEPGPRKPDDAVPSLARWYHKRGFRQGEREPAQWRRGGAIRREPQ